ncbi:MAG: porphobilinogen synthase [Alphaproteobacteria bacterium]|nr:porphobilinogen synthase [Alphaproteobacteria bacterium]
MLRKKPGNPENNKSNPLHGQAQADVIPAGGFPDIRMRRLRSAGWIREMVAEYRLHPSDLIQPLFITEGQNRREPVTSLPGVDRVSPDLALEDIKQTYDFGIKAFALFPVTPVEKKTMDGREALNPGNLICQAIETIKKAMPDIGLITDIALDPYTTHGHDGIYENGKILNDETVDILCKQAILQAQAGSDIVAPSDMMDGRIGAIRRALDAEKLQDTIILSYAAKYASAFYGPFREAVGSQNMLKGDKKTYQMNPANSDEALREVALDIQEGADMVMVKPGLPYLDIIRRVKDAFRVPTLAYHVSGEYAMLRAAAQNGWLDYDSALAETLLAFKRAGCDAILTYGATDFLRLSRK